VGLGLEGRWLTVSTLSKPISAWLGLEQAIVCGSDLLESFVCGSNLDWGSNLKILVLFSGEFC
jgi:hypothetical protein